MALPLKERRSSAIVVAFLLLMLLMPGLPSPTGRTEASKEQDERPHVFIDGTPIWQEMVRLYGGNGGNGAGDGGGEGSGAQSRYIAGTGLHCVIYVEQGFPTQNEIDALIAQFDGTIWPIDTDAFGNITVDRINIIIQEIDGPYGIGGFYQPGTWDIHIDAADLTLWGYEITTHEFQHLIHDKYDRDEELWLNEAMADLAIELCYGPDADVLIGHKQAFEETPDKDLTSFENDIADYGASYLFGTYVYDHYGHRAITRAIVADQIHGLDGVIDAMASRGYRMTTKQLFINWSTANRADDITLEGGIYGYHNVSVDVSDAQQKQNYPVDDHELIDRWAADSILFTNGDGRDLTIEVTDPDADISGKVYVTLGGGAGTRVQDMNLTMGHGLTVIHDFGTVVASAILIVGGTASTDFKFKGEYRDVDPPTTTMVTSPMYPDGADGWFISKPNIQFFLDETGDTFFWWDDETSEQTYCPGCTPRTIPDVPEGEHVLHYYSMDQVGNTEVVNNASFKVDTLVPESFFDAKPAWPDGRNGWYISVPNITLRCDECNATHFSWDDDPVVLYKNGTVLKAPEGQHILNYRSVDTAGNNESFKSMTFKLDTVLPNTTLMVDPAYPDGPEGWYKTAPSIMLFADDPQAQVYYSWAGGASMVYNSKIKAREGENALTYWAEDDVGNAEPKRSITLKVDTTPPGTISTVSPVDPNGDNGWYTRPPSILLTVKEKKATVYFHWDDETDEKYTPSNAIVPPEGVHTLSYHSVDFVGNKEPSHRLTFMVDTVAPSASVDVNGGRTGVGAWYKGPVMIEFSLSEGELGSGDGESASYILYQWDDSDELEYVLPVEAPSGKHTLTYYAKDLAGNKGTRKDLDLSVDNEDPVAYFRMDIFAYVGGEVTVDASESYDDNTIVQYEFDFGEGEVVTGQEPVAYHSFDDKGVHTVTVTVTDESGRTGKIEHQIEVAAKHGQNDNLANASAFDVFATGFLAIVLFVLARRISSVVGR